MSRGESEVAWEPFMIKPSAISLIRIILAVNNSLDKMILLGSNSGDFT